MNAFSHPHPGRISSCNISYIYVYIYMPCPNYQMEIYPNQNGVIIKLTYRGFCVLLTASTGPQDHKWHTWTTNNITLWNPFYYFKTILSLSVLCHDEEPFLDAERNIDLPKKVNILTFVQYKRSPSAYTFKVYHEELNTSSKLMKNPGGSTNNNWLLRPRPNQSCSSATTGLKGEKNY